MEKKKRISGRIRTVLFIAAGVIAGLIYYLAVGCPTGYCPITSNVFSSMAYFGIVGLWLSMVAGGRCWFCGGSCRIGDRREPAVSEEDEE